MTQAIPARGAGSVNFKGVFSIAPHGKTIIARLPYTGRVGGHIGINAEDLQGHVETLQSLLLRFGGEAAAEEHPFVIENEPRKATHLFYRFPPHVCDGGEACQIYLKMGQARDLLRALRAIDVAASTRKRVRPSAPGAPPPKKRVRR